MVQEMNIKPLDILFMLEDEDLVSMDKEDMVKLCNAISLDLQIEKESYGKSASNRRNMC